MDGDRVGTFLRFRSSTMCDEHGGTCPPREAEKTNIYSPLMVIWL